MILCALLTSSARAADEWILTTADFRTERVTLRGIDEQGLSLYGSDTKTRTVGFDQMLQLDRVGASQRQPSAGGQQFILTLAGGEALAGAPVALELETLAWSSPALGRMKVELSRVRSLARANHPVQPAASTPTEDVMTLVNGDVVRGIIANITDRAVTIRSAGGDPTEVPLDTIAAISFAAVAPQPGAPDAASRRAFQVSLADGTTVTAPIVRVAGDQLTMDLPDRSQRKLALASIVAIEQMNGPVVWLSSKPPAENVQTPFLGQPMPARMNHTVLGEPIRFGSRTWARGIGVHSYSRLTWDIDPSYKAFRTQYAIDGQLPYANVTARIQLDDRVVHEQKDFRAGALSPLIVLDTGGAKRITLEVDWGETYDVQDRFNWIEPALLKQKPKPPEPPEPITPPATAPATQPTTTSS